MERQTVDFGIDLGTTNSVIARATPRGVKIVKNGHETEITPSAVACTPQGQMLIGEDALDKPDLSPVTRFKRLMGTASRQALADGRALLPEEFSAEVLKELKACVQLRYDIQPEHVVITVPAMFQQPQCEATHRAAELAGLKAVTLLQEPIAAATACLNEEPEEGNYLVYDLGGGTFDVSIVRLRDGEMNVVAHGGDNYLGGADFDQKIFDWAVDQLEMKFVPLPQLRKPPLRDRLLQECEEAKKRLSVHESTAIDLSDFALPLAQLTFTRERLERLMEEDVARTMRFVRERLQAANLKPQDIRSILLVGGATKSPIVRQRLKSEFNIPLSLDHDPMTVVAVGAAIHASALLKPDRASAMPLTGTQELNLELYYEPVALDKECAVSGKVTSPPGFAGEVRLARMSGDWDTGWMPLRNGAFLSDVLLGREAVTDFTLAARDQTGTLWKTRPEGLTIRYGVAAARPVTPYNYGVALSDGKFGPIVSQGKPLPAQNTVIFGAAKTVSAGSEDSLVIHFIEGHSTIATDNVEVGELKISGADLSRTLRAGEKIEVRIQMDESRRLEARVSIPMLDLDFKARLISSLETPHLDDLEHSLAEAKNTVQKIEGAVTEEDQDVVLRSSRELEQLEAQVENIQPDDVGVAERAAKKLADIKAQVRGLSDKYGATVAYREANEAIDLAAQMTDQFRDSLGQAQVEDMRRDAEDYLRQNETRSLQALKVRAMELFWKHYPKTEECWTGWIEFLRENRESASDARAFHEYLRQAEDCLQRHDVEGVRWNVVRATAFLPKSEVQTNRFYNAGLRSL